MVTLDKEGIRESAVSLLSLHSDRSYLRPTNESLCHAGNSTQPRLSFLIYKMETMKVSSSGALKNLVMIITYSATTSKRTDTPKRAPASFSINVKWGQGYGTEHRLCICSH